MRRIILALLIILTFAQIPELYAQRPSISKLIEIYNNPNQYPNYIMLSAHRGYWKDYPENSAPAISAAIDLGVDMVEMDITRTDYSEDVIYLLHDWGLDRLTSGHGVVKKRINGEIQNYKTWKDISDVNLRKSTGEITEYKLITLRDALLLCKNKVLVSLDKAENIIPQMYSIVKDLDMVDQVTFKTKIQTYPTPESLKSMFSSQEDKENIVKMFTPTIFNETFEQNPTDIINKMKAFINEGCTGFEMIYFSDSDKMLTMPVNIDGKQYTNTLAWLRAINKRIIQFPEWPEHQRGNWAPSSYKFRNISLDGSDRRCDWEWLLQPSHRPSVIISDRLEVLFDYLKTIGQRTLPQ